MKKIVNIFLGILVSFMVSSVAMAQTLPIQNAFICQGDTLRVNDSVAISESGSYIYSLRSVVTGEDSLVRLVVNVYPTYRFEEQIHIQKDSSYTWHGQQYNQTGTYTKVYSTIHECDSIYVLNLVVDSAYTFHETASCCLGDVVEWQGLKISEAAAGEYQYKVNYTSTKGTDSTYYLALTVRPKPFTQQVITLCPGESVTFHGKVYSKPCKDTFVVPSVIGCDSTIEVIVKQYPAYQFRDTVHIKQDSSYLWHGQIYKVGGTYTIANKSIYGCDSIHTLTLIVDPSYEILKDTTVCFGEGFNWHNLYINAQEVGEKDYQTTLISSLGTDSVLHLHVTVLPKSETYQSLYFCHGGDVTFKDRTYNKQGRDTIVYQSQNGCDSLLILTINEYPTYSYYDTIYIAKGESVKWHNKNINAAGSYSDSYQTVNGCDSVYVLVVYEKPSYAFYQDTTICFGDVFDWHGQKVSEPAAGTYEYKASYSSIWNTDSIYYLKVTIQPKYWTIQQLSICDGMNVSFNGKTYTKSGRDTLYYATALGCDSVVEVIINAQTPIYYKDTVRLEEGKTLEWRGQTITEGGTYTDEYGCDSIFTVYVQMVHVDHFYQTISICEGSKYTWEGKDYTLSGDYTASYKNQAGNDSIMHLHLEVHPRPWVIEHLSLCQGSKIEYNGKTYTKASRDTMTFTSSHGCDSIVEVIVTETFPFYHYDTIQLEAGKTVEWHGQTLSAGGAYRDENKTVSGCDSIYEVYVRLYYVDHIYKDTTLCYGETYTWQGETFSESGEYTREKVFKNVAGTDSIMHLHLTILPKYRTLKNLTICQGNSITYNGKTYTTVGRDTMTFTSSHGCDSIVEVIVTEAYPFYHYDTIQLEAGKTIEWHGQTLSAGGTYRDENKTVSGCDSIYEVYVRLYYVDHIYKDTTLCYGETYTWQGETFRESGEYIREKAFKNVAGMDSIMHLHLTILPKYWIIQNLSFCHDKSITFNGKTYTKSGRDTVHMTSSTGCDSIIELIINEAPVYAFYDTITIWDTETYEWVGHGQTITGSGEYKDEHISTGGCDSTYYLKVNVQHKDDIYETATICYGDSVVWQGNVYKEVGVHNYEVTYMNQYGNDSTMHLHLEVMPLYWQQQPLYFCHGTSVSYNGKTYNQEGKDTIRFNSVNGCDSIVELIIKEYPTYIYQDTVHLQQGEELNWHGQTITQGGIYKDKQISVYGCDSTYVLTVIEDKVYAFYEKANACVNQTFEWQGLQINETEAGVYNYHVNYATVQGADSTYYLELTIYPSYFEQKQFFMCPGGSVSFNNHVYTQAGRDTIRLLSATGCDSLIEVIVSEYPSYNFEQTVHIKKGGRYMWNGHEYTEAGRYYNSFTTVNGCDSTYTLMLIVDSAYTFHDTAVACLGDVFEWQGLKIKEAAEGQYNYKVNYSTQYGMDSTYYLTLTVRNKPWAQQIITICPGENVTYHNKNYSKAGRDTIYIPSANGCDSVIEVVIKEYESYRFNDTVHVKKDSVYTWRGNEYSETGTYIVPGTTVNGCDSTYTLTLIVDSAYTFYEKANMCLGEIYEWQGLKISEDTTGVYTFTKPYTSMYGMDSVYHLTLTVLPSYVQYQYLSFCEGSSVRFGDSTYTTSGTDTIRLRTVGGCDSTIIVIINEQKRYFSSDTIELSNQQTFTWHGQTITQSGTYHDIHSTAAGCDSIYELVAVFYPTYIFERDTTICQCEAPYIWRLNDTTAIPLNHEAGQTRVYEQRYETVNHKDSIYRIVLTINKEYEQTIPLEVCEEGSYYEFYGKRYTESGTYTDTLKTIHGCDSIIHVQLNVLPKYYKIDTAYLSQSHPTYIWAEDGNTYSTPGVYVINNKTAAGCDSINRLVLLQAQRYDFPIEHDTLCSSGHDAIIWHGKTLTESGIYYDSLFTALGEDSIYSIELAVFPTYDTTLSVTLCEVELPYMFNNRIRCTETGTYLDTLHTIHGCDSVVRLELNVLPHVFESKSEVICETDLAVGYYFHGYKIINEGMYAVSLQSETQCNSVAELFLRLKPDLMESDSVVICAGDTYVLGRAHDPEISEQYNGITVQPMNDTIIWGCDNIHYFKVKVRNAKDTTIAMCENDSLWLPGTKRWVYADQPTTYYDTIQSPILNPLESEKDNCDSIVRWIISEVYPTYRPDTIIQHIPDNSSYEWGGKILTASGVYNDTVKTVACGCDSILTLKLIVDKTYAFRDSIHICQPHDVAYQHEWADGHKQSQPIWNAGVYVDSLRTSVTANLYHYYARDYKDSIYTLVVTMDSSYFFSSEYTLCQGDSVQLAGQWIKKAGVYTDSLVTSKGCDSIYQYVVNMTQSYYFRETKNIAQGAVYEWHGRNLNAPGTYYDSLQTSVFGCDSIYELTLNVYPTYHFVTDTAVCECQTPFLWHNQMLYETGTYYDRQQTIHRFDSIYELRLQVKDTSHVRINASTCEGDSVFFDNKWIKQAGVYYDTLTNAFGCDSIIEFVYTQKQKYLFEQTETTDDQHPFIWAGHKDEHGEDMVFTTSGLYQDKQKTIDGCDSIYRLTLIVYPTYRDTVKETICSNDNYYWRGNYYNETGCYTDALKTMAGYDSIFVLNLTVLPTSYGTEHLMICQGDSMEYYGKMYKTQGTYYDTLTSRVTGCDSIVSVIVTVTPKYYFKESAQTDDRHAYTWEGHKGNIAYNRTGVYYDSTKTVTGCDSIYELTLTVYPTYHFDTIKQTICASEAPYYWAEGQRDCAESGIYTARYATVNGYDSIYVLNLTVLPISYGTERLMICQGDSMEYYGKMYKTQGTYYDTLTSRVTGCDSIVSVIVTVTPKYYFKESAQTDDQHAYTWEGHKGNIAYNRTGVYYDSTKTVTGCDSIYELTLTVYPTYHFDTIKQTICASEAPYYWAEGQRDCAESGIYTARYATVNGYDSIYVLNLTVLPISYGTEHLMICQGDSMEYYGKMYKTQGTYYDTLTSRVTGCDSIVSVIVTVTPKYYFKESAQTDDQHAYTWEGHKGNIAYNRTGVYYDSTKTVTGCDSIYELTLTVYPTYHFDTIKQTICASEAPYYWAEGQRDCANSGVYTARYATVNGYDSIYVLDLTVNPTLRGELSVSICEGDSFPWNGQQLVTGGNYTDTISSPITGCDSIVTLHLFVKKPFFIQRNQTIYVGDTAFFEGDTLLHSGLYEKRYHSSDLAHCDSIIQLNLVVKPIYYRDTTATICESELPYHWNWHDEDFYSEGTYIRTTTTPDSKFIDTLHLYVDESHIKTIQTRICEGDTLYYRNRTYTSSGIFYDTIPAASGCDTIYKIVVVSYPTTTQKLIVHISEHEKYAFGQTVVDTIPMVVGGRDTFRLDTIHETRYLDKSGTYYDYNKNIYGCDSVTVLTLYVHPSVIVNLKEEICQSELPKIFNGKKLWDSGTYRDSMFTKEGYDSIVVLTLDVSPTYLIEESHTIKAGTHTFIHDLDISAPGIYYDSLKTTRGCDSVYKIIVNYPRTWKQEYDVTICQGETFFFHGAKYTQSGTYRYTSPLDDTLIIAHLTVHETKFTRLEKVLCADGDSLYYYHGRELKAPMIYRDTFKTSEGCDSIVILDLKLTEKCSDWVEAPLCKGDSLIILGDTIRYPGDYELIRKSKSGKNDSIYRVSFYEAPNFERFITDTICQGDTIWVGPNPITRAGDQTIVLKTVEGCDSIIHLNLTVHPSYHFVEPATILDYETYHWRGRDYNKSGNYDYVLPTIHNCDSIYTLNLDVIETQRPIQKEQICIGSTITWRGKEYSEAGIYTDTVCNLSSRTSIIYTLELTIIQPTIIQTAKIRTQEVCADAQEVWVDLTWTGATPQKYNVYFDARAHHEGFQDIHDAPFVQQDMSIAIPIPEMGVPAYENHMRYIRPDNYTMTLVLDNGVCGLSKSKPVEFLIRYPNWILEQNWNDVVAVLASEYNGGYEFSQYEWRINNAPMAEKLPYLHNEWLSIGDSVTAYLTRVGEDYSIPTCPLIITTPAPDVYPNPILIEPSSAPVAAPRVMIKAQAKGHYSVYSMMGQTVGQGDFFSGESEVVLPAIMGHYIIHATQEDGVSKGQKVIVY